MSYNVQVANGGYLGWKILERTAETQKAVFAKSAEMQRSRDYFVQNISKIQSAENLVGDYKLLSVALRAFGLDDDMNNRFFIRKVLEADPQDETSLVNRLPDKRYQKLNAASGSHRATGREQLAPKLYPRCTLHGHSKKILENSIKRSNSP
jgi:hypothetical protein